MEPARLILAVPPGSAAERRWVATELLEGFLGLHVDLVPGGAGEWRLTLPAQDGELRVPDRLLAEGPDAPGGAPADLAWLAGPDGGSTPVLGAAPGARQSMLRGEGRIALGFDLFGAAFRLLSRDEERNCLLTDGHGRFPAACSIAGNAGLLRRPLVDEWVGILRAALAACWPALPLRPVRTDIELSCDVDHPLTTLSHQVRLLPRELLADLVRRRDPLLLLRRLGSRACPAIADPFDTFDCLMDAGEEAGAVVTFNLLARSGSAAYDGAYRLDHPFVTGLLQRIDARGHRIGLHASYQAGDQPELIGRELADLRRHCERIGISRPVEGGRHHYLRCRPARHWPAWAAAGARWEASMGYADQAGFRCGTAHPYRAFDLIGRAPLPLVVRPLVAMDQALAPAAPEALACIGSLARSVRATGGVVSMLWHNSFIASAGRRRLFRASVAAAAAALR